MLNLISLYWFDYTKDIIPNHIISADLNCMPSFFSENSNEYKNRTVLVKKLKMLPYEFIVRGYMFGSMWNEYKEKGSFCGNKIEEKYALAEKLAKPILTPSAKNNEGHDEYISMERLNSELGVSEAARICEICLKLYDVCYKKAIINGIIIADTKFEFGYDEDGNLILGDEIFTPDSSRFWSADEYKIGISPKSYDKQFVRDWLMENKLNGVIPAPEFPENIVSATEEIYKECYRKITGKNY
jgi:phosphoribosylaminoimidazole-succinocarboxamide synthase